VDYQFAGAQGETLTSINIVQRQHFRVDDNPYNTVGLFKDCDFSLSNGACLPHDVVFESKANPQFNEYSGFTILNGKSAKRRTTFTKRTTAKWTSRE
jgi:hypothetical protein